MNNIMANDGKDMDYNPLHYTVTYFLKISDIDLEYV